MNKDILQKARELLELVAAELRKRGRDVVTDPADLQESAQPSHMRWIIKIDGDIIPLTIREPWNRRKQGGIEVRCDWVWSLELSGADGVRLRSKTFVYSKTRPATHGFDIKKIADHLELWQKTNKELRAHIAARNDFKAQWQAVADGLSTRFPEQAKFITSDEKGIHIALVLGEKQAVDVLEALAGESCRVCSVALVPREKPICEDCYAKGTNDGSDL